MGCTNPHHRWTVFKVSTIIPTSYFNRHALLLVCRAFKSQHRRLVMSGSCVHLLSTSSEGRLFVIVGPRIMIIDTYKLSVHNPNNDDLPHLALKTIRSRKRDNASDPRSSWILLRVLYTLTEQAQACEVQGKLGAASAHESALGEQLLGDQLLGAIARGAIACM